MLLLAAPAYSADSKSETAVSRGAAPPVSFRNGLLSVEANGRTLGDLLAEIRQKSGITFTMRKTQASDLVTVSFRDVPIEAAIRRLVARDFDLVWFYAPSRSGQGTPMPIEVWVVGRGEGAGAFVADAGAVPRPPRPAGNADLTVRPATAEDPAGEPGATALPPFIAALNDPDPRVRAAAAGALGAADKRGAIEPPGPVPAPDGEPDVRIAAAEATGGAAGSASVAPLGRLLTQDSDSGVRAAAADALGAIGSPESVALLRAGLTDADPQVRAAVVQALGSIAGREAERLLREALTDKDEDVRAAAFEALARLTPPTK